MFAFSQLASVARGQIGRSPSGVVLASSSSNHEIHTAICFHFVESSSLYINADSAEKKCQKNRGEKSELIKHPKLPFIPSMLKRCRRGFLSETLLFRRITPPAFFLSSVVGHPRLLSIHVGLVIEIPPPPNGIRSRRPAVCLAVLDMRIAKQAVGSATMAAD